MNKVLKTMLSLSVALTMLMPTTFTVALADETENDYPVILVHGNGGWGRDEKNGFLYWGGETDIEGELDQLGYDVRTAVVGPYSSNWDRACELYAYIVGDTVDYGLAHATEFGHDRIGRTFTGLYPEIGTTDADGINKIHLLSHSQGGQTVRVLVELLEDGSQEEIEAVLGANPTQAQIDAAVANGTLSKLFTGQCDDWVASVTSLASPHDGTTMANSVNQSGDLFSLFATPLSGVLFDLIAGRVFEDDYAFDLKLDQWGLTRGENESFANYFIRVLNSELWEGTTDFSTYDLSTYGAQEINEWVEDQSNVYYFSYACKATKKALLTDNQIPDSNYMNSLFNGNALIMGAYQNADENVVGIEWYDNDGYVNTISEDGPSLGRASGNIIAYDGTPEAGKWNYMGVLDKTDHEDIIGRDTSAQIGDLIQFYVNHLEILRDLP